MSGAAWSGGVDFDLFVADTVAELDAIDGQWQRVCSGEAASFLLRSHQEPEGHGEAGLSVQASLGAFRPELRNSCDWG